MADRLAGEGFLTLTPDLYKGEVTTTIERAEALRGMRKRAVVSTDILQALDGLQNQPGMEQKPVGVIGFSMGAWWSLWLAEQRPDQIAAVVLFYGARGMRSVAIPPTFLGHFAENDPYESSSSVKRLEKALKSAGKTVDFHTYPGTHHWFFEEDRPEYDPNATKLAWTRTVEFLHSN